MRRPGSALEGGAAASSEVLQLVILRNATLGTEGPELATSGLVSWLSQCRLPVKPL